MGHDVSTTIRCSCHVADSNMPVKWSAGHDDREVPAQRLQKYQVRHGATGLCAGSNRVGPLWGLK